MWNISIITVMTPMLPTLSGKAPRYPQPGEMLLYPGGVSETEVLLSYGLSLIHI